MASQAWLESSLRRSASLGLEVLERASRRSVDWTSTGASQTPTTTDEDTQIPVKRRHTQLDDAFATIAEFMAQTTYQCKVRGFMSLAVALSPLTLRGITCPGSIHDQLLGRQHLHCHAGNMVVCRPQVKTSTSRFHLERTPSLRACPSHSSRPSWSASTLGRVSTSPLTSDLTADQTPHP